MLTVHSYSYRNVWKANYLKIMLDIFQVYFEKQFTLLSKNMPHIFFNHVVLHCNNYNICCSISFANVNPSMFLFCVQLCADLWENSRVRRKKFWTFEIGMKIMSWSFLAFVPYCAHFTHYIPQAYENWLYYDFNCQLLYKASFYDIAISCFNAHCGKAY